ncbi:MAG: zinc ribbon domain-containing protein [Desulfobacterales bacterium]
MLGDCEKGIAKLAHFCPHCGKELSREVLAYFDDIARRGGSLQFRCPDCEQLVEAVARFVIELRKLPAPR